MKVLKKMRENLFMIFVALAYLAMFIIKPQMGVDSIKNSGYYIKEMLMIMPVIFVLTALLDMWIPKEKIQRHLGDEAKAKGVLLSFVLGSISAGPVYAAFPFCIMLYKKGASIRNIVIILSSWAVIKVPMLLNEAKFLGPKFMIIRYLLTVIAIIIFSAVTTKIVRKGDIPEHEDIKKSGVQINKDACMGCSLCTIKYPEVFYMKNKKAHTAEDVKEFNLDHLQAAIQSCPVKAIAYYTDDE